MPSVNRIAILSPGDMGHAVGRALREHGKEVITCLHGRSERTRELARRAGFEDVPDLEAVVTQADLILSILPPAEARNLARRVADALAATGAGTVFADCNAVSPRTTLEIGAMITSAGGRFVDVGIIGGPPSASQSPRLYASGPYTDYVAALDGMGILVRPMGDEIGRASSIKMCYAAMTKGTIALHTALLTAAELLGVAEELREEFAEGHADVYARMKAQVPRVPAVSRRWSGEMEEIAATFEQAGVTPHFHLGAAELYRMVGATPLADETPEAVDPGRGMEDTIAVFARAVVEHVSTSGR